MGSSLRLLARTHLRRTLAVLPLAAVLLFALGAAGAPSAGASATAPTLGKAAPFAVLAHTTVTNTGPTVVSGDLGVYPGSAVTGFTTSTPPGLGTVTNGTQYKATAVAKTAQASLSVAYTQAAAAPSTQSVTGKNLAGMRLASGVYTSTSSIALTGTVTLTGTASSVFIFQAASTLITGTGSTVVLAGGVQACNVFWQVGSSATLKTGTTFSGTVMASTSVSLTTTVTLSGRVLAETGAVTLLSDRVTVPTCGAATVTTTALSSTRVTVGASVRDVATVVGTPSDGTPTGSVQFSQCGPGSTSCAPATGTALATPATLSGGVATSASFTAHAIGTYCFAAAYTPASGSPYLASSETGSSADGECLTVTAAPVVVVPTTTTVPPTTVTAPTAPTAPTAATPAAAVVPATHTGEPWSGWLYWLIVAVLAAAGFGLIAGGARRRRLRHQENG